MATIDFHRFDCNLHTLSPEQLKELLSILGIEKKRFKEDRHYLTKQLISLTFAYPGVRCSIFIRLGRLEERDGRRVYFRSRLEVHGNFFDRTPEFSLARLCRFLTDINCYDPTRLDVGFMDTDNVTSWEGDWNRVAIDWRKHFTGSILIKAPVSRVLDGVETAKIYIGDTASKTAHAVVYRRQGGTIRLEIRFRDRSRIQEVLEPYVVGDQGRQAQEGSESCVLQEPGAADQAAVDMLIRHLDIVTLDSRQEVNRTKRADRYVREPFFTAFLASAPKRPGRRKGKQTQQKERDEQADLAVKALAGRINNFAHSAAGSPKEAAASLNRYLVGLELRCRKVQ